MSRIVGWVAFGGLALFMAVCIIMGTVAIAGPTKVDKKKFKTTKSGLKYAIIKPGNGKPAKVGQRVFIHYTGWLQSNGQQFDSSVDKGVPYSLILGGREVIAGWDEGIAGMLPGEKRQLVIPPKLAYKEAGHPGGIPPNATLVFDLKLVKAE